MVPPKINELLEKYYDGSATTNEINELIYYFHHTDPLPAELFADSFLFRGMKQMREELTLKEHNTEDLATSKKRWLWICKKCGVAASLLFMLVLVGKSYRNLQSNQKVIYGYYNGVAITDPHVAKSKMESSLMMVAPSLNKMSEEVNKLEKINRCQVVLNCIKP